MPDERFFLTHDALTFAQALDLAGIGGETVLQQPQVDLRLSAVAPIERSRQDSVIYAETESAGAKIGVTSFGLCLATPAIADAYQGAGHVIATDAPRLAFARIAGRLHREREIDVIVGVDRSTQIGARARLHASACVGERAIIGEGAYVGPGVVIGPGVEIGPDSVIEAQAVVTCALIGARVKVKPGARLGQSGFGFVEAPGGLEPVPQLGRLIIGDDVEIGANTTIDRGALGDTHIGDGTKIDNLVQIGHNVAIGRHCVIAAQVGFAGSAVIGDGVMIGGQAGFADHLAIGDGVKIAAKAGVMSDVPPGQTWGGFPARPVRRWLREKAMLAKLTNKKR